MRSRAPSRQARHGQLADPEPQARRQDLTHGPTGYHCPHRGPGAESRRSFPLIFSGENGGQEEDVWIREEDDPEGSSSKVL